MGETTQQCLLARQVTIPGRLWAGRALGGQDRHLRGPQECESSYSNRQYSSKIASPELN